MRHLCRKLKKFGLVLLALAAMPLVILHFQIRNGPLTSVDTAVHDAIVPRDAFVQRVNEVHVHLLKSNHSNLLGILAKPTEPPELARAKARPTLSSGGLSYQKVLHTPIPGALNVPKWQLNLKKNKTKDRFYLAEVLQVRIYQHDKAKWTLAELKQWMHYMFYAGVEHIFVCDHYEFEHEMLDKPLKEYIDLGLVTYLPWSKPRDAMKAQVRCYQHMINHYKDITDWQMAIDMDEYPFIASDIQEGFLVRYLKALRPVISEVSMHNFLMMGQGDRRRDMTIDRINRRTPNPANPLDKPIYRPSKVSASIHHNSLHQGIRLEVNDTELKMLHYWGARTQNWGPDTQETLDKTIVFNDVREKLAPFIRNSLIVFGETQVFSNSTGP